MNPWLLGAGLLALLGLASSKRSAPAPLPAPPRPLPSGTPTRAPVSAPVSITHDHVIAAVHVALAHETNQGNLMAFGQALAGFGGYTSESIALITKATKVMAQQITHPAPAHAPTPTHAQRSEATHWVEKFGGKGAKVDTSGVAHAITEAKKRGSIPDLMAFASALMADGYVEPGNELMAWTVREQLKTTTHPAHTTHHAHG